jgi:hypothetical protein
LAEVGLLTATLSVAVSVTTLRRRWDMRKPRLKDCTWVAGQDEIILHRELGVMDIIPDPGGRVVALLELAAGDHGNSPLSITEIPQVMTPPENRLQ